MRQHLMHWVNDGYLHSSRDRILFLGMMSDIATNLGEPFVTWEATCCCEVQRRELRVTSGERGEERTLVCGTQLSLCCCCRCTVSLSLCARHFWIQASAQGPSLEFVHVCCVDAKVLGSSTVPRVSNASEPVGDRSTGSYRDGSMGPSVPAKEDEIRRRHGEMVESKMVCSATDFVETTACSCDSRWFPSVPRLVASQKNDSE